MGKLREIACEGCLASWEDSETKKCAFSERGFLAVARPMIGWRVLAGVKRRHGVP